MAQSELSPGDMPDAVSVLNSRIKFPPRSVSGDLIRGLSTETTPDTSSGLRAKLAGPQGKSHPATRLLVIIIRHQTMYNQPKAYFYRQHDLYL